jgi:mannobiose 2-epimerase
VAPFEPLERLSAEMVCDLRENVLPFWTRRVLDDSPSGFVGFMDDRGVADPGAPRGGVLASRILWTMAAAFRRFGEPALRSAAERAFARLVERFWDDAHGGTFWMLDASGRPLSDRKQTYALAFAVYALAEYRLATGSVEAEERALALFRVLEGHLADPEAGGYEEARARDWAPLEDVRLSEKDLNAPKSMNTHLHVMEAYANLRRVSEDAAVRDRLRALVALHVDRILDPDSGHLRLFFEADWRPASRAVSYGHDVEASWLLVEAAERAADEDLLGRARQASERLARATLAEGYDRERGGVFAERHDDGRLDDEKHWWMQAEAVVGFLGALELTGESTFLDAAVRTWEFVDRFLVDREHGEWRWRVRRDGAPIPGLPKVEPWKCPYHNSRAALEVEARVERLRRAGA